MRGNGGGGLVHDLVAGAPPAVEGEVEPLERELEADHLGSEHADRLLEQVLTRLVALEHDDRPVAHASILPERPGPRTPGSTAG